MTKRILIIDDEKPLREALKDKIEEAGYTTIQASDGVEGLELALKEHPDLILLDLLMPKMNGQDMLAALREEEWGKTVPVIVLTNSNSNDTVYEVLKQDAKDYFVKTDISLKDIVEDVRARIGNPAE